MDTHIQSLHQENAKLKSQLESARKWMQKEISAWDYDHKQTVQEKIYSFFSPESLSHFPNNGVDNIVSAELIYKHLLAGEDIDGMGVVFSYQKILDAMVELYITKGFRKYIQKHSQNIPAINDPLEKSLRLIVEKKHIFSLGRLYQILKDISAEKALSGYRSEFSAYLKSRTFLEKSLRESDFLLQLESLIHLWAITDKRHSGTLNRADTITARKLIVWDFSDKNSILHLLASSQDVDI